MDITNQFHLTSTANRTLAQSQLACLVQNNAYFEDVHATIADVNAVLAGRQSQLSPTDTAVITQILKGWQLIIAHTGSLDLRFERKLNSVVALHDALVPGEIRTGSVSVALPNQTTYFPAAVDETSAAAHLSKLLSRPQSITERALRLLYHNMRTQLFWDGNKRTAILAANYLMLSHGAGLINVPLNQWSTWMTLIGDYYQTNQVAPLLAWSAQHAIYGAPIN